MREADGFEGTMRRLAMIACMLALTMGAAGAAPQFDMFPEVTSARACRHTGAELACIRAKTGGEAAQSVARHGRSLIRLIDWSAWHRVLAVIEYTRDAHGNARLHIADPYGQGRDIVQPLSAAQWHAAMAAVNRAREQAIHPPPQPPDMPGIHEVCVRTDGLSELAEVARPRHVERMHEGEFMTANGCFDPMDDLGETLRGLAVRFVPPCSKLAGDDFLTVLANCLPLSGDRLAAAQASNLASRFAAYRCKGGAEPASYVPMLSPQATLEVEGQATVSGAPEVAEAFLAFVCQRNGTVSIDRIAGGPDTATVSGAVTMIREQDEPGGVERYFDRAASYTQHWVRGRDGGFVLTQWRIEKFGPETEDKSN